MSEEGPEETVHTQVEGTVTLITLDDGKANAISHALVDGLRAALDTAEKEAAAVVLAGRAGRFSGGFDLSVMRGGNADAVRALAAAGAELALRIYSFPKPVVIACTGHAIAMGAVLLLTADRRVGAEGAFKLGLNETAIGMTLPDFALELARERLSKRHLTRATLQAEIYSPEGAVDAGFLDRTVRAEDVIAQACKDAEVLAALDARAYAGTKQALREASLERLRATLG